VEYYALANPSRKLCILFPHNYSFTILFAWLLGETITKKKLIISALILCGAYFDDKGNCLAITKEMHSHSRPIAFGGTILGKIATRRVGSWVSAAVSNLIGFIDYTYYYNPEKLHYQ
jgi:hypothetical protein